MLGGGAFDQMNMTTNQTSPTNRTKKGQPIQNAKLDIDKFLTTKGPKESMRFQMFPLYDSESNDTTVSFLLRLENTNDCHHLDYMKEHQKGSARREKNEKNTANETARDNTSPTPE